MGAINPVTVCFEKCLKKGAQDTALSCPGTRIDLPGLHYPAHPGNYYITLFPKYF